MTSTARRKLTCTIRLPNRTRSHFIRNPIAWVMQELFMPVLIIGGLLLFALRRRLRAP